MKHAVVFFAIALGGAGLDLLSKHLAFHHVPEYGEVSVIDGFFAIGHTTNRGVVFGKFGDKPMLWTVVSVLAVPAIVAIFFSGRRPKPWVQAISLGMILAGTIGNMVDRLALGAVRDFIKFHNLPWIGTWPLFNLADSFICIGVFLLSIEMVFFEEKKAKEPPPVPAAALPGPPPGGPSPANPA